MTETGRILSIKERSVGNTSPPKPDHIVKKNSYLHLRPKFDARKFVIKQANRKVNWRQIISVDGEVSTFTRRNWQTAPPLFQYSKTIINRFLKLRNKFANWEIGRKNDEQFKSHQRGQGYDPGGTRQADEHDGSIDWKIRKAISKVKYTFVKRNRRNTAVQCFRNYWRRNGSGRLSQDQIL